MSKIYKNPSKDFSNISIIGKPNSDYQIAFSSDDKPLAYLHPPAEFNFNDLRDKIPNLLWTYYSDSQIAYIEYEGQTLKDVLRFSEYREEILLQYYMCMAALGVETNVFDDQMIFVSKLKEESYLEYEIDGKKYYMNNKGYLVRIPPIYLDLKGRVESIKLKLENYTLNDKLEGDLFKFDMEEEKRITREVGYRPFLYKKDYYPERKRYDIYEEPKVYSTIDEELFYYAQYGNFEYLEEVMKNRFVNPKTMSAIYDCVISPEEGEILRRYMLNFKFEMFNPDELSILWEIVEKGSEEIKKKFQKGVSERLRFHPDERDYLNF